MDGSYWAKRQLREQDAITERTVEQTSKALAKYYRTCMNSVISDFEATYDKLQATVAEGHEATPADLYKLDRYWQMQIQLKEELQALGDKEVALLSESFENQWREIYEGTALTSDKAFSTISTASAESYVNTAWCADGKTYSSRVWGNVEKLSQSLNEELISCVVTGKKTTELREKLISEFGVSNSRALTLIRTECAHIQTQAAAQRYQDMGLEEYEFLGREEGKCGHSPDCSNLNGKKFRYDEMSIGKNCPPIHPNCRCAIIPVVPDDSDLIMEDEVSLQTARNKELVQTAGKINPNYQKGSILSSRESADTLTLKGIFLKQLDATSKKIVGKGDKKAIREMVDDYQDSMFKQCVECGRVFIKDNPKSNRATRCPECQARLRKQQKADYKARVAKEKKRRESKAAWARANRAKKSQ